MPGSYAEGVNIGPLVVDPQSVRAESVNASPNLVRQLLWEFVAFNAEVTDPILDEVIKDSQNLVSVVQQGRVTDKILLFAIFFTKFSP